MKLGLKAVTASALVVALAVQLAAIQPAEAGMNRNKRMAIMRAVVRLVILKRQGSRLVAIGNGSGTIISKDGLILTNNHVVSNVRTGQVHDAIAVTVTKSFDKKPKAICLADPSRAIRQPALDLAIVKCERELNGKPLRRRIRWPVAPVGDSKKLIPGDELYIVGYPAVAGATITFTAGKVSGFLDHKNVARAWIKTDALISPGVSGGAAFNGDGELVGIPTLLRYRRGGRTNIGLARPVRKARPLLAQVVGKRWARLARRTVGPRTRYVMPRLPGQPGPPPVGPDGVPRGMREYGDRPGAGRAPGPGGPGGSPYAGGSRRYPGYQPPPGGGMTPGSGGPGSVQGRPGRTSVVAGIVVDASTMRPIRGAVIMVVRPGVSVRAVRPSTIKRYLATAAISDGRGIFRSKHALRHGRTYGVLVQARGYQPLAVDGAIQLYPGTPPLLNVGRVRLMPMRTY
ncbi:MAG: trypsin-like peptidase domain-containing protein [Myxococcales bacterium]|nr:trypsin-like peptidase domain-containing protein [Myxococcales bacterium]